MELKRHFERNVASYPWYRAVADGFAWMPVFFLFFAEHVSLREVIQLGSIYYVGVVALEVPSGYFSDRVGRRPTLIISAVAFVVAYGCFLTGDQYWWFAAGQVFLATGMAFRSGTDTALHYDSLAALGREQEYGAREARAQGISLTATALAVLAGGAAGTVDLRLPYALSLVSGLATLWMSFRFTEPAHGARADPMTPGRQLRACAIYLRQPLLAWLFGFYLLLYVLAHVPYDFYQPFLKLLETTGRLRIGDAPLVSGMVMAATMGAGAWAAARSVRWSERFGLRRTLLGIVAVQLVIIAAMAAVLHPAIVAVLLLRSVPMALAHAPFAAAVTPRIGGPQRATYLSLHSFAGRLAFGALLYWLSKGVDSAALVDWSNLASMLRQCTVIGATGVILLALLSKPVADKVS